MIEAVEIIVRQPGYPDRTEQLRQGATRIGRAEDNELVLSDVGVSRRHAQIYWSSNECIIEDLGSGNGTYHHGRRIQTQPMVNGGEIVIDPFVLGFRLVGQDVPRAQEQGAKGNAGARMDVVVGTGMAGSSYPIHARGLSIGRSEERDVVIPDPASSRHHCQISLKNGAYILRDMGSANGVFVNAVRIREQHLQDGDLVRVGNTEMRFVQSQGQDRDLITQVLPAGDPAPQNDVTGIIPTSPSAAPAQAMGSSIWLWVTGFATLGLGGLALVAAIVIGAMTVSYESPPTPVPSRSPAWVLNLPGGLESGSMEELFTAGTEKLRNHKNREALQDFYRVLTTQPAHGDADKFALAAGERLVLSKMQTLLDERAATKADRVARKAKLLRSAKRSGRAGRQAEAALREEFREDPEVISAMSWEATGAMIARVKLGRDAAKALAQEDWSEAAKLYSQVLVEDIDPDVRMTALGGLKTSRRELTRMVGEPWRKAVVAAALNQDADAEWARVQAIDSNNPCAALQPR